MKKLLIANRGEIALRIMRSAKSKGLETVAVYTDADADAPHRHFADEAVRIGEGPAGESYLSIERLLEAALQTGADAVHPGYGFLSERAEFCRAVAAAGLSFVGPSADAIDAMGNKAAAKRLMIAAGVPCIPGYEGAAQDDPSLITAGQDIGFPLMVKAAAGGGGRGMRLVHRAEDFADALALARSEAQNAFGSAELILERAILRPRHVEVQVFADQQGSTIHLGERDCSVQRRHQKVVEEAPCPVMTPALRTAMGEAAVQAAQAVDYVGAGTVEFLLDDSGDFYFLEMNTRLQVEHPVTELVTGLDLVALQLDVAQGLPLPLAQDEVALNGHAIEVRLYAEDPGNDFLPAAGTINVWRPSDAAGVRTDAGIVQGQSVSPFYDPMVAKVIAHGANREQARQRLIEGLGDTAMFGPANNRDFLLRVLDDPTFAAGEATTALLDEVWQGDFADPPPAPASLALATVMLADKRARETAGQAAFLSDELLGWHSGGVGRSRHRLLIGDEVALVELTQSGAGEWTASCLDQCFEITVRDNVYRLNGTVQDVRYFNHDPDHIWLCLGNRSFSLQQFWSTSTKQGEDDPSTIAAPMHGLLQSVFVSVGDRVAAGQCLAVLEAMKMQHQILAQADGKVEAVGFAPGTQVAAGSQLFALEIPQT